MSGRSSKRTRSPAIESLLDQLERSHRAHAWHGPALLECLAGLSPRLLAAHPVKGAHSIWELVEHVATWNEVVARRLAGEKPQVTPELNFPRIARATPSVWKATLRRLARSHLRLRREVASFPAAKLRRQRPGVDHTWYVLIHGQIQHALYHAGQIAQLRRALGRPIPPG